MHLNKIDKNGKNTFHYAVLKGNFKEVKYLIEKDADINASDYNGRTAIHHAAQKESLEVVKYLTENGAGI